LGTHNIGSRRTHLPDVAPKPVGSQRLARRVNNLGVDYCFVGDVVAPYLARGRCIFCDLSRRGALVRESVPLFIASSSRIFFVKEGLDDVEVSLAGRAPTPREMHAGELE
jgi:hypothetical protein